MKEWILGVASIVLLSVLLELLLSEGRVKKYTSGIIRVILVFSLLTPIFQLVKGDFVDLSWSFTPTEAVVDTTVLEDFDRRRKEETERKLEEELSDNYYAVDVEIVGSRENNGYVITSVNVYFSETGIKGNEEHRISTAKVKDAVLSALDVTEEMVLLYGIDQKDR